ncbi:YcxB family protein [Streptomyces sp. NBC_01565]|uniref:YcxB family protein n=1 Tax=Streptomyces sp. NBC_01565 TaxID=2975881 RepID=UPI00224F040B|nr:YcxB family protein [Streptomyces sp. NBC_01565]MCX4543656.1 YcxB family protein [Streptomyces sp. NBC_01565]
MNTNDEAVRRDERTVELVYRTSTADVARALRARDAHTAAGRRRRWAIPVAGTFGLGVGVLEMVTDGAVTGPALGLVAAGALLWMITLFGPRLQARAFRGLLEKAGETRAVVDGSGVLVATASSETRIGWAAQPTYAETADAFVMLSDDKGAVAMTVLPKRGIQAPADADGLRALLDANLRRL